MKIEELNKILISTYRKIGDDGAMLTRGRRYTGNEIADEIENETKLGNDMVDMMIQLTVDLIKRDKINLPE